MAGRPGFLDLSNQYEALSAAGDPLERLTAVVDFEVFRGPLVAAMRRSPRGKGGRPPVDLAIPMFGYKNHIGIDPAHGLIRTWDASAANAHDGARLLVLDHPDNTASGVLADTALRSKKNEAILAKGMFTS